MRVLQTLMILLLWPWWTLRAALASIVGVALIVSRQILDVWAPSGPVQHRARRKPL